jgi:hypothetical protein
VLSSFTRQGHHTGNDPASLFIPLTFPKQWAVRVDIVTATMAHPTGCLRKHYARSTTQDKRHLFNQLQIYHGAGQ